MANGYFVPHHIKDPDYLSDLTKRESSNKHHHWGLSRSLKISKIKGANQRAPPVYCYLSPSDVAPEQQAQVNVATIWKGLKEGTTAHGIPHVTQAKGPYKRGFWSLMVLITLGFLIFNFYAITKTYFAFNVTVTVKLKHETELLFPAVTICNMSPVRRSAMKNRSATQVTASSEVKSRRRRDTNYCEIGWLIYGESCYLAVDASVTFLQANSSCTDTHGAQLTSILDASEQSFVASIVSLSKGRYWIGISGWPWVWSDGSTFSYSNWHLHRASTSPTGSCAALGTKFRWMDLNCGSLYNYVCKTEAIIIGDSTTGLPTTTAEFTTIPETTTTTTAPTTTTAAATTSASETTIMEEQTTITTELQSTAFDITTASTSLQDTTEQLATSTTPSSTAVGILSTTLPPGVVMSQSVIASAYRIANTQSVTSVDSTLFETPKTPQSTTSTEINDLASLVFDQSSTVTNIADKKTTGVAVKSIKQEPCCCTCCFSPLLLSKQPQLCDVCDGHNITNAETCTADTNRWTYPMHHTETTIAMEETTGPSATKPDKDQQRGVDVYSILELRADFEAEEKLTYTLAEMPEDERTSAGFSAADLILDCQYAGYTIPLRHFETFHNPVHGNCYIFNSGWNNVTLRKSSKAGRRYGLHIVLNVNQNEYVPESGDTAGMRLVVHPQNRMPFPEDEGITVSPGHSTSIGIRQVQIEHQPAPYGRCINPHDNHADINVYEEINPVSYSSVACQKTCYQRHVIDTCQCGDPHVPLSGRAFPSQQTPVCNTSDITQGTCIHEVKAMFKDNLLQCDCRDSCSARSYSLEVSVGMWPSKVQKDDILRKLKPLIGSSFDTNNPKAYKQNLAKAEIYFEEFNFELISERPAYPAPSYLSDIGGVLGLWVGFSILTLGEFMELALDLCVLAGATCRTVYRKRKRVGYGTEKDGVDSDGTLPSSPPPPYDEESAETLDKV